MLENGRSKNKNGGVKKKVHHKNIQRWEMTTRSVKEKKCKSSSTNHQSNNDKNVMNNKHLQEEVLIPGWLFPFHRHRC